MPFSATQEELYTWLKGALPRYLFQSDAAAQEIWGAAIIALDAVREQIDDWLDAVFILTATDLWLNAHAKDRGTFRQLDETDAVLRDRLRTIEDAVTPLELKEAIDAILTAAGVAGESALVELRRDMAYMGDWAPSSGTGGTFAGDGGVSRAYFTPNDPQTTVLYPSSEMDNGTAVSGEPFNFVLTLTNATNSDDDSPNPGDFLIEDVTGDAMRYENGDASTGADAAVDWRVDRYNEAGSIVSAEAEGLPPTGSGRSMAFLSRGYRVAKATGWPTAFIFILPYGTTAATALAVQEALRKKKAGGIKHYVERRTSPP